MVRRIFFTAFFSIFILSSCADSTPEHSQTTPSAENAEQAHQARVEQGMAAYQQAKFKQTYDLLHPLAEEGNIQSQVVLGEMYKRGNGVSRSLESSFQWYLRAAEQQHAEAQYQVANMYAHGMGVPQDLALASIWSQRAQANGFGQQAVAEEEINSPPKENL